MAYITLCELNTAWVKNYKLLLKSINNFPTSI
jgi:hypothetical protein